MIKNGHHATDDQQGEAGCCKPGTSAHSPEKRKRVVRLWCDGWWVSVPAPERYTHVCTRLLHVYFPQFASNVGVHVCWLYQELLVG